MIDLVSSSKNKDSTFTEADYWMLIPRWSDRLEAVGWIGIVRCWDYCKSKGSPLWTENTLKAKDYSDLYERVAPPERYIDYNGKSSSFMDHIYDKLLHLGAETGNKYIDLEMKKRIPIMKDLCILFGKLGFVPNYIYNIALREIKDEKITCIL